MIARAMSYDPQLASSEARNKKELLKKSLKPAGENHFKYRYSSAILAIAGCFSG